MPSLVDGKAQRVTHTFSYYDAKGVLVAQKRRIEPGRDGRSKEYWPYQRVDPRRYRGPRGIEYDPETGMHFVLGLHDARVKMLPYRLPELRTIHAPGIWATEGESDADAVMGASTCPATTVLCYGAEPRWAEYFRGYTGWVRITMDRDEDGKGYRLGLGKLRALSSVGLERVYAYRPPEPYNDVRDLLGDGGTLSDLERVQLPELQRLVKTLAPDAGHFFRGGYPPLAAHDDGVKVGRTLIALPKWKEGRP